MRYRSTLDTFVPNIYEMLEAAEQDKDRTTAITAGELANSILMMLLKLKLRKDRMTEQLFENNGPLETFSNKIKFMYAIIDKQAFEDLNYIRRIRNEFAHTIGHLSFSKSPIRELCKELSTFDQNKNVKLSLRNRYSSAVANFLYELIAKFAPEGVS